MWPGTLVGAVDIALALGVTCLSRENEMLEFLGMLLWCAVDLAFVLAGKLFVRMISLGRGRGESLSSSEGRMYGPAGALSFQRDEPAGFHLERYAAGWGGVLCAAVHDGTGGGIAHLNHRAPLLKGIPSSSSLAIQRHRHAPLITSSGALRTAPLC